MGLSHFAAPFKTAFDPEVGLYISLNHLLGRRIVLHQNRTQLNISYWKFDDPGSKIYAGRVHISPAAIDDEITLVEDIMGVKLPGNFPMISERTTSSDVVNMSLFYPDTNENWNFRIHYKNTGVISDKECKFLIAEGRLINGGLGSNGFGDLEKVVYNPPRTDHIKLED